MTSHWIENYNKAGIFSNFLVGYARQGSGERGTYSTEYALIRPVPTTIHPSK
jgi:hypothetical protein